VRSRLHPANQIKPVHLRMIEHVEAPALNQRRRAQWKPESRRVARQLLPKVSRRPNSNYRERLAVDKKVRTHYRWVAAELFLPRAITHYRNRSRALAVIARLKKPALPRLKPERAKCIAGDKLRRKRLRRMIAPGAPYPDLRAPRLERRQARESRRMVPEFPVLFGREQRPAILHSAVDAAVLVIANADKLTGVGHRQRLQQHGMYQRESRSSRANAQRQRQHRGDRKSRTPNKLSQRISNVFKKHGKPPCSNLRSPERSGSRGAYVTANGQIKRNVRRPRDFYQIS